MEKQPISKLEEFNQKAQVLIALKAKRGRTLEESGSWVIAREDSDLEEAAKAHARQIVETGLPQRIARLDESLSLLEEKKQEYIQIHATELREKAAELKKQVEAEKKVIDRLKRDLKRGFTTQEVIERRASALKEWEEWGQNDPEIALGLALLAAPEQKKAEEVQRLPHPLSLTPLSDCIKPIVFRVEKEEELRIFVDREFRIASKTSPDRLDESQKQLINDVDFVEKRSDQTGYRRVITPEELHSIIVTVKSYITESDGNIEPSVDFQRRVVEFAARFDGYDVNQKELQKRVEEARKTLDEPNFNGTLKDLEYFSYIAARQIKIEIITAPQDFYIAVKKGVRKSLDSGVYQAAFDLAFRDLFKYRSSTRFDHNLVSWSENRQLIESWYFEHQGKLGQLRLNNQTAEFIQQLESAIQNTLNTSPDRGDSYRVGSAISLQLKIGHLIDDINSKLQFIQSEEEALSLIPTREVTADEIVSLLPQLEYIATIHEHKYQTNNTVLTKKQEAEILPSHERSEEQVKLLESLERVKCFTDADRWMEVYTPEEFYALLEKLELLSCKSRPDFGGVEAQILAILERRMFSLGEMKPETIKSLLQRANNERNRQGMQWNTLITVAKVASDVIREGMTISNERSKYLIPLKDPNIIVEPDLTAVYQFVADNHTLYVIGKRSIKVDNARQESFIANSKIVNEWFKETRPVLEILRVNPEIRGKINLIFDMVNSMNMRLKGGVVWGQGKDYKIDPAGAISLQKKIGYMVEEIKLHLSKPDLGTGIDSDIIVPLD